MAVKVHQRRTSGVQFIDTARELLVHTLNNCKKFPKSMMFFVTKDIVKFARDIYASVIKGNTVYPKTKLDIEIRYKHFVEAKGTLDALNGILSVAKAVYGLKLTDYAWRHWGELINKEKRLINAIINSDKKIGYML